MALGIFKRFKTAGEEEEYLELEFPEPEERKKVPIIVEKLENLLDAERVQRRLREGFIVIARIRELRERDMETLKGVVNRIKKTCIAIGGDIAGIGEDYIIATPANATIVRKVIEPQLEKVSIQEISS